MRVLACLFLRACCLRRGIVFPNEVYNPYTDDGYAMETFLDRNALNASRPVYLCGGERLAWENGE